MTQTADPVLHYIAYEDFLSMTRAVTRMVATGTFTPDFIIGVGRGGLVPAVFISHELQVPMLSVDHSSKVPNFADELLEKLAEKSAAGNRLLFVDDINDSGGTIDYMRCYLADHGGDASRMRFAVLIDNQRSRARVDFAAQAIDRDEDKRWFVFPWEAVMTAETLREEAMEVPDRLG
jgi:xanthine phosphoribosyltransferase